MAYPPTRGTYASKEEAMKKARERAAKLGHTLGRFARERHMYDDWHCVEIGQKTAVCDACGVGVTVRWLPHGKALRLKGSAIERECSCRATPRSSVKR